MGKAFAVDVSSWSQPFARTINGLIWIEPEASDFAWVAAELASFRAMEQIEFTF
jgi:hypothetical protein